MRQCKNCDAQIGNLERAFAWESSIVCAPCYAKLSTPHIVNPDRVFDSLEDLAKATSNEPSETALISCPECDSPISRHASACPKCGAPNTWVHPQITRFLSTRRSSFPIPLFDSDNDRYVLRGWDIESQARADVSNRMLSNFFVVAPMNLQGIATMATTMAFTQGVQECMNSGVKAFIIDFSTSPPAFQTTDDGYWRPVLQFFGLTGKWSTRPRDVTAIKIPLMISAIGNLIIGYLWARTCFGIVLGIPMFILCVFELMLFEKAQQMSPVQLAKKLRIIAALEILAGLGNLVSLPCGILALANSKKI
jgi:hypothetical protein